MGRLRNRLGDVEIEMVKISDEEAILKSEHLLTVLMRCALRALKEEGFIDLEIV